MRVLLTSIILLSLMACNQKKNIADGSSLQSNEKEIPKQTQSKEVSYNNDCFSDRKMTKEVTDVTVKMAKVMDHYMFTFDNTRWQACEVPMVYCKQGLEVIVSGQVLELRPNERRAGTPFKITDIKSK